MGKLTFLKKSCASTTSEQAGKRLRTQNARLGRLVRSGTAHGLVAEGRFTSVYRAHDPLHPRKKKKTRCRHRKFYIYGRTPSRPISTRRYSFFLTC